MHISFHGAARTVTGSKHLLTLDNQKKILLDCGMFQGMGSETMTLNQNFGFEASAIDMVILSHAHIDHIGLLPKLVKEGFKGPIYCTEATASLVEILLKDSAHIQQMDVLYINKRRVRQGKKPVESLYNQEDAERVFVFLKTVKYHEWFTIDDQIELLFTDAGHLIGSACVHLKIKEQDKTISLSFSGDLGRYSDTLLRKPQEFPQADYVIMESTYGDQLHPLPQLAFQQLYDEIKNTCLVNGGKLIIPAFSIGRTQEILYGLNQLSLERRLPKLSYYVDSPMSVEATKLMKDFHHLFNDRVQKVLEMDDDPFDFPGLTLITDVEDSKLLNFSKEPWVVISASGMAEAGRVKHHIANHIEDDKNTILLAGYCEPQSLGGRLLSGAKEVHIFGELFQVKAKVSQIQSLSAHGDYQDMLQWLSCQDTASIKRIFLVHGEYEVQKKFAERIKLKGFKNIEIPFQHQEFNLTGE